MRTCSRNMIVNMSVVVKRAIFISNNFLNLNVSVHNGTFIRRELPYQIERQFVQQLILPKSKKKKKNDENTKWFICMGKSRENSSQLYPGFLHNYLFYDRIELIPAGVYFFSLFQVHDLSWFLRWVHSVDVN